MAGVSFLPIQAGTGDPSPTNVRPITPGLSITGIGDIYGGYLDVANGCVVETWSPFVVDGSKQVASVVYHQNSGNYYTTIETHLDSFNTTASTPHLISDKFKVYNGVVVGNCYITAAGKVLIAVLFDQTITTKELATEWFKSNPILFVYELATPITHPLTTAQLIEAMQKLKVPSAPAQALHRRLANTPHPVSTTPASIASFDTDMVGKLRSAKFGFSPIQNGSGNAFPEQTYNGSIVSFNYQQTKTDSLEFKANFLPKQEGTGDPSPTNVRPISGWTGVTTTHCGKNLFDPDNLETLTVDSNTRYGHIYTKPGNYYLNAYGSGSEAYLTGQVKDVDGTLGSYLYIVGNSVKTPRTVNLTAGQQLFVYDMQIHIESTASDLFTTWEVQVVFTSTAVDTYSSYTGTTYPITFPATGKNLLDESIIQQGTISSEGAESATNRCRTKWANPIFVGDGTILAVRGNVANKTFNAFIGAYADSTTTTRKGSSGWIASGQSYTVPAGASYVRVTLRASDDSDVTPTDFSNVQLEKSSTATAYEPYTNTAYGGYVDLLNNNLVVEWEKKKLSDITWNYAASNTRFESDYLRTAAPATSGNQNVFCSCYKAVPNKSGGGFVDGEIGFNSSNTYNPYLIIKDSNYTSTEDFVASLTDNDVLVYKLATPITIPISPQTVSLLTNSVNTVWSDADSVTVKVGNVRPISGWDGLNVTKCGKNLWDDDSASYSTSYWTRNGHTYSTTTSSATNVILDNYILFAGITYTLSFDLDSVNADMVKMHFRTADNTIVASNASLITLGRHSLSYTPSVTGQYRILVGGMNNGELTLSNIQLEIGSTATAYAPYTGSTYPVTWQSAGTIYGGYVDLCRDVVVATHGAKAFDGSENWEETSSAVFYVNLSLEGYEVNENTTWISNMYPFNGYKATTGRMTTDKAFSVNFNTSTLYGKRVFLKDSSFADTTELKTYLYGHPLVLYGPLATPITYAITPTIIKSLKGANNLWSNANGDATITYWTH